MDRVGNGFFRDVQYIRFFLLQRGDLILIEIDADDLKAGSHDLHGQRQTDVAKSDHCSGGGVRFEFVSQWVQFRKPPVL